MKINDLLPFDGQHCETTATGTLLNHLNIRLSEPMLFGLGEGLGFIFWNMKSMDFPFIGGRIKPDALTENIVRNLDLRLNVKETSSIQKAWEAVKNLVDNGTPVGLKLDCFHLEYFSKPIHFAGHYVAIYGYDDKYAYVVDTRQQGGKVKTSLQSLSKARAEKGPMSSRNLYYTISGKENAFDWERIIPKAIRANAKDFLNPPITNIGFKGIDKTSKEVIKWFNKSKNVNYEFGTTAMMMEKAGTGGSLFRNFYRDFLKESHEILDLEILREAWQEFSEIAERWKQVSELFEQVSSTGEKHYVEKASILLKDLSNREKQTMEKLAEI